MSAQPPRDKPLIFADYDGLIDRCGHVNQYARAIEVQQRALAEISPFIERIKAQKAWAVEAGNEVFANDMFHMQCMLRSMESSLSVWLAVKKCDIQTAWSHLIDAQEYKDAALIVRDYEGIRAMERQLNAMELALFPHHALYNSAGFVETIGDCSICGGPFARCDHVERRVYMGRLCRRINRRFIEADHVALVANPLDKRCVVTSHSNDDGRMIDQFTLEDVGPRPPGDDAVMFIEAVLMTGADLDFD